MTRATALALALAVLAAGCLAQPAFAAGGKKNRVWGAANIKDALGGKYDDAARKAGMSVEKFKRIAEKDPDFGYSTQHGKSFYSCHTLAFSSSGGVSAASVSDPDPTPVNETMVFKLHSRPGAPRTILLDFTGFTAVGTAWNSDEGIPSITSAAYDTDGNPNAFSTQELKNIISIWRWVSADYASFDVDVTTEETDPDSGQPINLKDRGVRCVIGGDDAWLKLSYKIGGIAYVDVFGDPYYTPAYVFPPNLGNGDPKAVAEAASHEIGHNLGLSHDGTSTLGYYTGHANWAPIMGVGYYKSVSQWSKGEYTDASNQEDDLAIMTSPTKYMVSKYQYLAYRNDDHGNNQAAATALTGTVAADATRTTAAVSGNIERTGDTDFFSFKAGPGAATITLSLLPDQTYSGSTTVWARSDLDAKIEVFRAGNATPVATFNPQGSLLVGSSSLNLPAKDTYYLAVTGVGDGTSGTTGYTNYGSLGEYDLALNYPTPAADCPSGFTWDGTKCNDINECLTNNGGCDANALCANTNGSFTCTCKSGFTGTGLAGQCADVNECLTNNGGCDANALCANYPGGSNCTCKSGFTGSGLAGQCVDVDECLTANGGCHANAACTNTVGGRNCTCNAGYIGSGVQCAEINECTNGVANCSVNADCNYFGPGNFSCSCKSGFTGDGNECTDVDECATGNGGCDTNAVCNNFPGGYNCTCNAGFSGTGQVCADIDECATNNGGCGPNAVCTNSAGSYSCACKAGFTNTSGVCTDINECLTNNGGCDANAVCGNFPGGSNCTCKRGFTGTGQAGQCTDVDECTATGLNNCSPYATCTNLPGNFSCACKAGFTGNGVSCIDVNECLVNNGGCGTNATCINTPGNYSCACKPGYADSGTGGCTDINECATNNGGCGVNATCTNTPGSFSCGCKTGFRNRGSNQIRPDCRDIDECGEGTHRCARNAYTICNNTLGNYTCVCKPGWTLAIDGLTCVDINECLVNNGGCGENATCTNTPGSFLCNCKKGFRDEGRNGRKECRDINECEKSSTHNCHPEAGVCRNLPGNYTCTCRPGFVGNGFNCQDVDECAQNATICGPNATCKNKRGGYSCECKSGYTPNLSAGCVDVNECSSPRACPTTATCTNTPGSYSCACLPGYGGKDCKICTGNTVSPGGSTANCSPCSSTQVPNTARTACMAKAAPSPSPKPNNLKATPPNAKGRRLYNF